jgi:cardiolipin synthase (CMP-forming)
MPTAGLQHLPNLITLARIALVPVLILLLKDQDYPAALLVFLIAGASDALDGYLAKRLGVQSRLGGVLDPAADKLLLVSSYVMLTILGHIPFWLMLAVAFRDVLIVGGYLLYTSHAGPVKMRPSILSKLNTLMQIALVGLILAKQAAGIDWPLLVDLAVYAVLVTTVTSGAHYLWSWMILKDIISDSGKEGRHD